MSHSVGLTPPQNDADPAMERWPATHEIDITVPHSYWLGKSQWLAGVSKSRQAGLLLAAGIFLLTQISETPNLSVQVGIVGTVLTLGGVALLVYAAGLLRAALTIDTTGVRARVGWTGFDVAWLSIERWAISD